MHSKSLFFIISTFFFSAASGMEQSLEIPCPSPKAHNLFTRIAQFSLLRNQGISDASFVRDLDWWAYEKAPLVSMKDRDWLSNQLITALKPRTDAKTAQVLAQEVLKRFESQKLTPDVVPQAVILYKLYSDAIEKIAEIKKS